MPIVIQPYLVQYILALLPCSLNSYSIGGEMRMVDMVTKQRLMLTSPCAVSEALEVPVWDTVNMDANIQPV
jgi:hypothetical protein